MWLRENSMKTARQRQVEIGAMPRTGDTLAAKIAAYMETTLGLAKEEIASIRRNILGDASAAAKE